MSAKEAALAELLGAHGSSPRFSVCTCGWTGDAYSEISYRQEFGLHLASVLLAAGWLPPETVTGRGDEFRAEGLRVAALLLRRVAEYWDGRPLTHHGDHIHADLMDVLRAVEADADSLAPEAPSEEQR